MSKNDVLSSALHENMFFPVFFFVCLFFVFLSKVKIFNVALLELQCQAL